MSTSQLSSTTPEIPNVLLDLDIFKQWIETVDTVDQILVTHPTQGETNGFDIYNPSHMTAQTHLLDALVTEGEYRNSLKLEVAKGVKGELDILARLALLHSIDRFSVRPSSEPYQCRPLRAFERPKIGTPASELAARPLKPVTAPESTTDIARVATVLDASSRLPRSIINNDKLNTIEVTESVFWSVVPVSRRGKRQLSRTLAMRTTFDGSAVEPLRSPTLDPESEIIRYDLPDHLTIAEKLAWETIEGEPGRTDLTFLSPDLGPNGLTMVPLVSVMLAMGQKVDSIYSPVNPISYQGRLLDVVINGVPLPVDPNEYFNHS